MNRNASRLSRVLVVLLICGFAHSDARALGPSTSTWTATALEHWDDPTAWSNGVPGAETNVFIDNGGEVIVANDADAFQVSIGTAVGTSGTLLQNGGDFTVRLQFDVAAGGDGVFEFQGGTFHGGELRVAPGPGANGSLAVSGGTFLPGYLFLGQRVDETTLAGSASAVQSGGKIEVFYAGLNLTGPDTTYELQDGTLLALDQVLNGKNGTTRFIQTGGLNDALSPSGGGYGRGELRVGLEGPNQSYYELRGGDLQTRSSWVGAYRGNGVFVQTAGTHHAVDILGIAAQQMGQGGYELTGGALAVDKQLTIGSEGPGELAIVGADASADAGDLLVGEQGTLTFAIGAEGVTRLDVQRLATIEGALEVLDDGAPAGQFVLVNAQGALDFRPADIELPGPLWRITTSDHGVVAVKAPEPGSLALVALAAVALGVTIRQRRLR